MTGFEARNAYCTQKCFCKKLILRGFLAVTLIGSISPGRERLLVFLVDMWMMGAVHASTSSARTGFSSAREGLSVRPEPVEGRKHALCSSVFADAFPHLKKDSAHV